MAVAAAGWTRVFRRIWGDFGNGEFVHLANVLRNTLTIRGRTAARGFVQVSLASNIALGGKARRQLVGLAEGARDPSRRHQREGMICLRHCSKPNCEQPAVATLTYDYRASTVVLGPLATVAEPHAYDLCMEHAQSLTVPRGWQVIRLQTDFEPAAPGPEDLMAIVAAVREVAGIDEPQTAEPQEYTPRNVQANRWYEGEDFSASYTPRAHGNFQVIAGDSQVDKQVESRVDIQVESREENQADSQTAGVKGAEDEAGVDRADSKFLSVDS